VAQRLGRGIALLFHDRGTRRGWVVSSTPGSHFTPGKDPVSILRNAGWASGPVWTGGKTRPHRDSIPDRPARSAVAIPTELPGPPSLIVICKIIIRNALFVRVDQERAGFGLMRTSVNQDSSLRRNTKSCSLPGTCLKRTWKLYELCLPWHKEKWNQKIEAQNLIYHYS